MYWITIKYELINYLSKINENAYDERTCVVPENIHTPSTGDHWKLRGGGGGDHGKVFSKG